VARWRYSLQPDSETIKEITLFSDSWWRNTGHLHSIANSADEIIPPPEALLGDRKLVLDGQCSRDLLFLRTCHGAVLADSTLNTFVACHWITTQYQCSPRPTPTPTRTPLPTSTPTPTRNAFTHSAAGDTFAHGYRDGHPDPNPVIGWRITILPRGQIERERGRWPVAAPYR